MNVMLQFDNVTAHAKANLYFDGKVISHAITLADGSRKTLGVILPGSYHFGTAAAERMEITDGSCRVTLDGASQEKTYATGCHFDVPAHSGFTIVVDSGAAQYVCSYL